MRASVGNPSMNGSSHDRPHLKRCSKARPCSHCEGWRDQCRYAEDGSAEHCYRVGGAGSQERRDKSGRTYYSHRNAPVADRGPQTRDRSSAGRGPDLADAGTRNEVYGELLDGLILSVAHGDDLDTRGFQAGEAHALGYRTMPPNGNRAIADRLLTKFGRAKLLTVPGFIVRKGEVGFSCLPGLLIPVRDRKGRIIASKVRPDNALGGDSKYLYVTSVRRDYAGPSPGSPIHVSGLARTLVRGGRLRHTEGEIKSDLAELRSGLPTIGAPEVGAWRNGLDIALELGAGTLVLSYDADWPRKPVHVARPLAELAIAATSAGLIVEMEVWDEAEAKGVDDLFAAEKQPTLLTGADVWAELRKVVPDIGPSPDDGRPRRMSPSRFYAAFPRMREPVIDGLLRRTEVMNVVAPSKIGKSWLVLGLLVSVATGRDWLGRFPVARGRVLLIDNELHPETISSRMRWVAESMGLGLEEYDGQVEVECLRGRLRDLESMGRYFEDIRGQFDLVILDSGYRFTTPGDDENSNASVTARYNLLDHFATLIDSAVAYIHHVSKGLQTDKAITDIGAGAGAQSRAADTHLVLVNDPALGAGRLLVDAAIRSFPPIEPFVIRREGPSWVTDEAAPDVEECRQADLSAKAEQRRRESEAREESTLLANVGKVVEAIRWLDSKGKPATANAIRDHADLSGTKAGAALARAERDGRIAPETTSKPQGYPGPKTITTYQLVTDRKAVK